MNAASRRLGFAAGCCDCVLPASCSARVCCPLQRRAIPNGPGTRGGVAITPEPEEGSSLFVSVVRACSAKCNDEFRVVSPETVLSFQAASSVSLILLIGANY